MTMRAKGLQQSKASGPGVSLTLSCADIAYSVSGYSSRWLKRTEGVVGDAQDTVEGAGLGLVLAQSSPLALEVVWRWLAVRDDVTIGIPVSIGVRVTIRV